MEYIFQVMKSYPSGAKLTKEIMEVIRQNMEPIVMNKGDVEDHDSPGSDHLFFVEKGWIREIYFKDRKAVSRSFKHAGQFIVSSKPYQIGRTGNNNFCSMIEALENSIVYYISNKAVQTLYSTFRDMNLIHIDIIMRASMIDKNHYQIAGLKTYRERYKFLSRHLPELLNTIEPKYLASYSTIPEDKFMKLHEEWKLKAGN